MPRLQLSAFVPILACLVAIEGCAAPTESEEMAESSDAIVGGSESTAVKAIGYVFKLWTDEKGRTFIYNFCTATMIAPDVVLTAAHCFGPESREVPAKATFKGLGFGVGKVGGEDNRLITAHEIHPDYARSQAHDLAYAKLAAPIEGVQVATIRRSSHAGGCGYVATGYGKNKPGAVVNDPATDADIRKSTSICVDSGLTASGVIRARVGASGTTCAGDSGGPLRLAGARTIVGTLIGSDKNCQPGASSLYAPIISNLDFIDEALSASAL